MTATRGRKVSYLQRTLWRSKWTASCGHNRQCPGDLGSQETPLKSVWGSFSLVRLLRGPDPSHCRISSTDFLRAKQNGYHKKRHRTAFSLDPCKPWRSAVIPAGGRTHHIWVKPPHKWFPRSWITSRFDPTNPNVATVSYSSGLLKPLEDVLPTRKYPHCKVCPEAISPCNWTQRSLPLCDVKES